MSTADLRVPVDGRRRRDIGIALARALERRFIFVASLQGRIKPLKAKRQPTIVRRPGRLFRAICRSHEFLSRLGLL
jgi:hypothetical protein